MRTGIARRTLQRVLGAIATDEQATGHDSVGNTVAQPTTDADRGFQALLADYTLLREEWIAHKSNALNLLTLSVVVHGFVLSLLSGINGLDNSDWIALIAPLVPWIVMGFYVQLFLEATLRSFYGRAIERSMLARTDEGIILDLPEGQEWFAAKPLPGPLYLHMTHQLGSMKRQYRWILFQNLFGILSFVVLTLGETAVFVSVIESRRLQWTAISWYSIYLIIDIAIFVKGLRGESLWRTILSSTEVGLKRNLDLRKPTSKKTS